MIDVNNPILAEEINEEPVPDNFPQFSISAINCNTLNMSSLCRQTKLRKLYGILSLKTDIIFMSDLRLCNRNGTSDIGFLKNVFAVNPYGSYTLYHQSRTNKRGVGILVKKTLNFTCLDSVGDQEDDNYLLLRASIQGFTVILGSIYGPSLNNERFFDRLMQSITSLDNDPVILGGDWNTVFSTLPLASNPDVLNMQDLPNANHSRKVKELCNTLKLTDPYRTMYPNMKEYSYAPWNNIRNNRSRIDFFLISECLTPLVNDCFIKPSVQSKMFDHKAILLDFKPAHSKSSRPTISKKIMNDPDLDIIVESAVFECYAHYLPNGNPIKPIILNKIGIVNVLMRQAGPDPAFLAYSYAELLDTDLRINLMDRLMRILMQLRNMNILDMDINIEADLFFEVLINNVRNAVISYQSFIFKKVKESSSNLEKQIKKLKVRSEENLKKSADLNWI
jgi:exonuclease III